MKKGNRVLSKNKDFIGISEMLLESFEDKHPNTCLFSDPFDQNVQELSEILKAYIDYNVLDELIQTRVGRGVILGMASVFRTYEELNDIDEGDGQ